MGPDAMILVLILSFKPAFTHSSFTLIKRLFISAIRVVSSAYMRLLIFLPANLIPACNSSSHFTWCTLHISYISKVKNTALMYFFPNLEPVYCSMSGSNCCFLTCIQISQEAGKMVRYYHLFKSFPSEKAMATHSSTLAWKIPWMEEPGRLQSMVSLRVRHD